jgi:hypothetical protein
MEDSWNLWTPRKNARRLVKKRMLLGSKNYNNNNKMTTTAFSIASCSSNLISRLSLARYVLTSPYKTKSCIFYFGFFIVSDTEKKLKFLDLCRFNFFLPYFWHCLSPHKLDYCAWSLFVLGIVGFLKIKTSNLYM